MALFRRVAEISAGPSAGGAGFSWTGLDVEFSVVKTSTPEPNSAKVTIYNLSEDSRAYLLTPGLDLVVSAGYEGDASRVLFRGDVDLVTHRTSTEDAITVIQALDGKRARGRRISRSYSRGTPLSTIAEDLLGTLGVSRGSVDLSALAGQRTEGLLAAGGAARYLDSLLASAGLAWSIQDGVLQVHPESSALAGEGALLSPDTGMIGQPERFTEQTPDGREIAGLQVVTLLDPGAAPGLRVRVESSTRSGVYRTRRVEHRGALAGPEWYTIRDLVE